MYLKKKYLYLILKINTMVIKSLKKTKTNRKKK